MPAPTLATATLACTASRNHGELYTDPWCGILSTSAVRSAWELSRSAWAASSTSPVSNTRPAGVIAFSTSELLFTIVPDGSSPAGQDSAGGGPITSMLRPGQLSRSPGLSCTIGTPAAADSARTWTHAQAGTRDGPTPTAPTDRPRSTMASPPT